MIHSAELNVIDLGDEPISYTLRPVSLPAPSSSLSREFFLYPLAGRPSIVARRLRGLRPLSGIDPLGTARKLPVRKRSLIPTWIPL
jgi:hypothetical protein